MQSRENVSKWERDISRAHLASICGVASGIIGKLTWNRSEEISTWLDKEALESNHSREFHEFVTVETKSRKKNRKRARRVATTNDLFNAISKQPHKIRSMVRLQDVSESVQRR